MGLNNTPPATQETRSSLSPYPKEKYVKNVDNYAQSDSTYQGEDVQIISPILANGYNHKNDISKQENGTNITNGSDDLKNPTDRFNAKEIRQNLCSDNDMINESVDSMTCLKESLISREEQ